MRLAQATTLTLLLLLLTLTTPAICYEDELADTNDDATISPILNIDGININSEIFEDTIDDALRSKDERERSEHVESSDRHPFDKACPHGYFICDNGECIAPRWRCDGHADCDDYSDELNCTSIDMPQHSVIAPAAVNLSQKLPNISASHLNTLPVQVYGLDFNSSIEPLMIFSTGQSIRGLWMRSRIYFDIVTRKQVRSSSDTSQPSITEAFSLFFGMLGLDPSRGGLMGDGASGSSGGSSSSSSSPKSDQDSNVKPENTIVGLDMNPANKEVFWVELGKDPGVYSAVIEDEQFEAHQRRQFHGHKKIVEYGLLSPEDIAIDSIGKNVYITDAGLPAVVVCSYTHVHCRILVQTKIHKPRAIIADSQSGWVVFTDWGDRPGIYLVTMDGKRRETLIETDVVWPNGLAHDFKSNSLYWADARLNKIEKVDLKTRKRTELVKEINSNPFSVSVFENRVYWSDWSGNEIKTCDKETGNNTRKVIGANDIYGIHIYHPDMSMKINALSNPCWSKHCSHLCLLSPSTSSIFGLRNSDQMAATCACPDSMALSILDKATCYEVHLSFLLVNVKNYIAQVFPERIGQRVVEEIVYSRDHAIQDIASDWLHYKLFFFDASRKQLFSADFSGRKATIQKFATIGSSSIRGLVYDLQSDNLFWLDPDMGTLHLMSVHGSKFQKVLRNNLDHATSMVLDTRNRVFYMSIMGSKPRIIRTDIMANEASDVVVVDKSTGLGLPIALHLDEQAQRLYWADTKFGQIESVGLDVKSRKSGYMAGTRTRHRSRLGTILSFAVYHDYLIWVIQDSDYIYKARRDEPKARPVPFRLPPGVSRDSIATEYRRLITLNPMAETLSSPCYKRACSHACIIERDREAKCICPDNFKLQALNRSNCIEASQPDSSVVIDERASSPLLRPNVINRLAAASGAKQAMSAHQIDQLTHTKEGNSKDVVIVEHLGQAQQDNAPQVSHAKSSQLPHLSMEHLDSASAIDETLGASIGHEALLPVAASLEHHDHEQQAAAALSSYSGEQHPVRNNKIVWLITFLLVLTAGGLITIVSLMIFNKQGRLARQVSQLTVSFVSPSSSIGGGGGGGLAGRNSGIDKDKTMLLLDTDS